jgi:hypothetical protein
MQASTITKLNHPCNLHYLFCLCPMPLVVVYALQTNKGLRTNNKLSFKSIICVECTWLAMQAVGQDQCTLVVIAARCCQGCQIYNLVIYSKHFLRFVHLPKCTTIDDIQNKISTNTALCKSGKTALAIQ